MKLAASPEARLRAWRHLRDNLPADPLQQLEAVANYWGNFSLVKYYIDWDNPASWPSPWQILNDGELCPSGCALMVAHTLLLATPAWAERIELLLIRNSELGIYVVVLVDREWLLNYEPGCVLAIDDIELSVIETYRWCRTQWAVSELL